MRALPPAACRVSGMLATTLAAMLALPATRASSSTTRFVSAGTAGSPVAAMSAGTSPAAPGRPASGWTLRDLGYVAPPGSAASIAEPSGVLCDAFGRIWLSDAALHTVIRWHPAGGALEETGALGSAAGQFRRPGALANVGSLGVAVLDIENRRVSTYDHHLRLIGAVDLAAPALEERIGRVTPVSVAADRGGALYVADAERDRVLVFDPLGTFQRELGGFGARAGGFAGIASLVAGPRGSLITVERPRGRSRRTAAGDTTVGRSRVQWLDAGARVTRSAWTPAWGAGGGEVSLAVAMDDSGRVAVAAERSGELCVISATGELLAHMHGLSSPRAVAFAADGTLLVAEAGAARLRRLVLEHDASE